MSNSPGRIQVELNSTSTENEFVIKRIQQITVERTQVNKVTNSHERIQVERKQKQAQAAGITNLRLNEFKQ